MGGWVAPLGDSLVWGAPRKGGSKGGNQGGGRAARPCASCWPADLHHFPGGRGPRRQSSRRLSPSASCSATARVALLLALKRRAKRRGPAGPDVPHVTGDAFTAAPAVTAHGPDGLLGPAFVTVCKPSGRCPESPSLHRLRHSSSSAASCSRTDSAEATGSSGAPLRSARAAGWVAACTAFSLSMVTRV